MESAGTWVLDILFEQFNFEIVIDNSPKNQRAKFFAGGNKTNQTG